MNLRMLLYPFALLYGAIIQGRNKLYDHGVLYSKCFDIPIICVGNLSTGGTGKSPHVRLLAEWLSSKYRISVLSRGYGRNTKGFFTVSSVGTSQRFGDEPLELKRHLPQVTVAVCEDRVAGVKRLLQMHPDLDLILLDDGFQHRAIRPSFSILLTEFGKPLHQDHLLPAGNLREPRSAAHRADVVMVTKVPEGTPFGTLKKIETRLRQYTNAPTHYSSLTYKGLQPVFGSREVELDQIKKCILLTGIANPQPLREYLEGKYNILAHIKWPDHHDPSRKTLENARKKIDKFATLGPIVITSEKDAMRLLSSPYKGVVENLPIYYLEIGVRPWNENRLKELIEEHVRANKSHR